jgi:membrane protein DedA with SNARE-associated domain
LTLETVLQWISAYGYEAIFFLLVLGIVGLPVPDETLLTFTGYLVFKGQMTFAGALTAACLGSACGITISYLLGRNLGLAILHRYGKYVHVTQEKIDKIHAWFHRVGRWTLTFGYFIPGVRHFTAYVAGTAELPYREFAVFAYAGSLLWPLTFISLGYFFGEHWNSMLKLAEHYIRQVSIAAAFFLVAYLLWRFVLRRKAENKQW